MPLPEPGCVPAEACCTNLFDYADHILDQALAAYNECRTEECPAIVAYVTLGRGDDGIVDALTVAFTGVVPKPVQANGTVWVNEATFVLRLRETGWPVVSDEGGVITFPDPVVQNNLARHVYGRLERILRRMVWLARPGFGSVATAERGRMAPDGVPYLKASVSGISPLDPQGGVIGGFMTITITFG